MFDPYHIDDPQTIFSPGLVIFRELLEANIARMISMARDPSRLRPHAKTHKMPAIAKLEISLGITKHKCATPAEAEMLAQFGVLDVLLAYQPVGPNVNRVLKLVRAYPQTRFSVLVDHPLPLAALGEAFQHAGLALDVLLDLDVGQHRTGVPIDGQTATFYRRIDSTPGVRAAGLHAYDGHTKEKDPEERRNSVLAIWRKVSLLREQLLNAGLPVPKIVAGGTPSFPIYAPIEDPHLELSPGTCVFHDVGYGTNFPDLPFTPAALILTRVVSKPAEDRVTLDLGYKACASDPPADRRVKFPDLADAEIVLQNEEHLVLKTSAAARLSPGDALLAIPWHVCPTAALHRQATVISQGKVVDRWDVTARDR